MKRTGIASFAVALGLLCGCTTRSHEGAAIPGARETSVAQLKEWLSASRPIVLIDVREDDEWKAGHAVSAIHIPRFNLPEKIGAAAPNKSARIVLYCRSGKRSAASYFTLQRLGYTDVYSLAGGLKAYEHAGLPVRR